MELVTSFRATLEEVKESGAVCHIIDASNASSREQMKAVESILSDIGVSDIPILKVFNKIDLLPETDDLLRRNGDPDTRSLYVSARTGDGIEDLKRRLREILFRDYRLFYLRVPRSREDIVRSLPALHHPAETGKRGRPGIQGHGRSRNRGPFPAISGKRRRSMVKKIAGACVAAAWLWSCAAIEPHAPSLHGRSSTIPDHGNVARTEDCRRRSLEGPEDRKPPGPKESAARPRQPRPRHRPRLSLFLREQDLRAAEGASRKPRKPPDLVAAHVGLAQVNEITGNEGQAFNHSGRS